MPRPLSYYSQLTLIDPTEGRKYLNAKERERFYRALQFLPKTADRLLLEVLYWTGCRISEALALDARFIDIEGRRIALHTLKQRGDAKNKHIRVLRIPPRLARQLDRFMNGKTTGRLWSISRTTAWRRVKSVMNSAGIKGLQASPKGLRHAFGAKATELGISTPKVKTWMGHADAQTTEIYMTVCGPEDDELAARMWKHSYRTEIFCRLIALRRSLPKMMGAQ